MKFKDKIFFQITLWFIAGWVLESILVFLYGMGLGNGFFGFIAIPLALMQWWFPLILSLFSILLVTVKSKFHLNKVFVFLLGVSTGVAFGFKVMVVNLLWFGCGLRYGLLKFNKFSEFSKLRSILLQHDNGQIRLLSTDWNDFCANAKKNDVEIPISFLSQLYSNRHHRELLILSGHSPIQCLLVASDGFSPLHLGHKFVTETRWQFFEVNGITAIWYIDE